MSYFRDSGGENDGSSLQTTPKRIMKILYSYGLWIYNTLSLCTLFRALRGPVLIEDSLFDKPLGGLSTVLQGNRAANGLQTVSSNGRTSRHV